MTPASAAPQRAATSVGVVAALAAVLVVGFPGTAAGCTRVASVGFGECPSSSTSTGGSRGAPDAALLRKMNQERARAGLPAVAVDTRAADVAVEHARRMAAERRVHHNPALRSAEVHRSLGYPTQIGENVGAGPSADSIHTALMRSARHRGNILHPSFSGVGIGVHRTGETLWVVQVFVSWERPSTASGTTPFAPRHATDAPARRSETILRATPVTVVSLDEAPSDTVAPADPPPAPYRPVLVAVTPPQIASPAWVDRAVLGLIAFLILGTVGLFAHVARS